MHALGRAAWIAARPRRLAGAVEGARYRARLRRQAAAGAPR
jgi:hypothetical protein